ncbi:hypothetical protein PINS_up014027 [Pythium insidiosum]|nr:hypothetical protein PINS_up014027 [Pythium insidiosum]
MEVDATANAAPAAEEKKAVELPGFRYDPETKRYFKLTAEETRVARRQRHREKQQPSISERPVRKELPLPRRHALTVGWMGALQRREIAISSTTSTRVLRPAFYAARMATASLRSVHLPLDRSRDRFTTMDVNSTGSMVAIGLGTGQLRTYSVGSNAEGLTLLSSTPESDRWSAWAVVDPWTAEWSPRDDNKFSVGCAATGPRRQSGAALIDVTTGTLRFAPRPPISSDVLSQSFSQHSEWMLNGTRNGGLWLWDARSPVVELSWRPPKHNKDGSIASLHVLSDDRQAVIQRSNGALCVVDLRSSSSPSSWPVVTAFSAGRPDQFSKALRCHVSSDESVIVAPSSQCVELYALSTGRLISTLQSSESMGCSSIEQTLLHDGHEARIWAMGRHDVLTTTATR